MPKYNVSNIKTAHSFGVYEADSPEAAIDAACRDAGYDSKAAAEAAMGRESELVAVEATVELWMIEEETRWNWEPVENGQYKTEAEAKAGMHELIQLSESPETAADSLRVAHYTGEKAAAYAAGL